MSAGAGTTPRQRLTREPTGRALHRALGFRDLLFFYIVTTFSLRWIATAAAAGPSALVIWIIAAVGLFVPLVFATLELSSRYPDEGGIYVWSKRAFGPFSAFITGWLYWATNLPYFPSLLYFAAGNLLFVGGPSWQAWSSNSVYFITAAMIGLTFAVSVNVVGLDIGKWLNNAGGISAWIVAGAADPARRRVVGPLWIGDRDQCLHAGAEHQSEGRDFLVHDRVRLRRRRERLDDGRGDSRCAPDDSARGRSRRRSSSRCSTRGDTQHPAGDSEGADLRAAGRNAGACRR